MRRLIDADKLIEKLQKGFINVNYHPDLGDPAVGMEQELHNEFLVDMLEEVNSQPTAYDVDKVVDVNSIMDAMAKVILRTDFGNCALCDNYAKNITIDGKNNGCDGNCRHDNEYSEKDVIEWFKAQLRWKNEEGAIKDE